MEIKRGTETVSKGSQAVKPIIEFYFSGYVIYVVQGKMSQLDIVVRYKQGSISKRLRKPRHIHWVVNLLLKRQGNEQLAREYILKLDAYWKNCQPLPDNSYETIRGLVEAGLSDVDMEHFASLNAFGEYDVEFLYVLIELLSLQEKTNRKDAHVFGEILTKLLEPKLDIYGVVYKAVYSRRKA